MRSGRRVRLPIAGRDSYGHDVDDWRRELAASLPEDRVSTRDADLDAASRDESSLPAVRPEAIVWPASTEDVVAVVRLARRARVAVTARGAGTSLEGNPIPIARGIVVDLSRMNRVLEVRSGDLAVRVEPGVVFAELNRVLRPDGLFFPPSPGGSSDTATIGGMVANDASGIYSVRYGGTRDSVLAATVVVGDGSVVRLGSDCRKSSSGYHLLGLFVGSEGTLGIATEITLRLRGLPAAEKRATFGFPSERAAADAIAAAMAYGVDLAAVEFLDRRSIEALNRIRDFGLGERPTLFVEAHGTAAGVDDAIAAAGEIAAEHGGGPVVLPDGRSPWEVRHHVTRSIQAVHAGQAILRTDLAFPISRLPEVVEHAYRTGDAAGSRLYAFGHAGLGILHVLIPAAREDAAAWTRALEVKDRVVTHVLGVGGSVSGEHGLGLGNRGYAPLEHGAALDLMKGVKRVFDPDGILNPGKIWP